MHTPAPVRERASRPPPRPGGRGERYHPPPRLYEATPPPPPRTRLPLPYGRGGNATTPTPLGLGWLEK
jgi:hypothetical protein